ncbi:MAG: DUF1775 domain-containing protein [Gaiellaceae bacterium]
MARPAAAAHVEVSPDRIAPGSSAQLTFSVPNERTDAPIVGLELTLPAGLVADELGAKPGWKATRVGRSVSWRGGRILSGEFATFSLVATAPQRRTSLVFAARELFAGAPAATYAPTLTVGPDPRVRDGGARTLGAVALGLAALAAALALAAAFGVLALWLLSPLQER